MSMIKKEITLRAETELRCEVNETDPLYIRLLSGTAEIFGIELANSKEYSFLDESFAIFSWAGCVLELYISSKREESVYIAENKQMISYVNIHCQLEARRDQLLSSILNNLNNNDNIEIPGPHVLIVGPSDHGKSSVGRMLTSWAARGDRCPLVIDLDGQPGGSGGQTGMPGSIWAAPVDKTNINIEVFLKYFFF